ncbi:O-antigen ligase family protein [Candidatus Pelagibacter communis]|uniref:O-antigen ligase family protein n=1 Tax=Pelagibacter ubique TaxID=198252 RepID=UPI00094C6C9B|nr:O-antigen ligase family protein [Candidatus Pelagibacter ubique]
MTKNFYFNNSFQFNDLNFNKFSLSILFFSLLFSSFSLNLKILYNINISLFDVLVIFYFPFILKNFRILISKKLFIFLGILGLYIFLNLLFEIYPLEKSLNNLLYKKKILLFLQFFRSAIFFILIYLFIKKIGIRNCISLLIKIFLFYCIVIIIILILDVSFLTKIILKDFSYIYFNDVQRASEIIRLKGFFNDPNHLGLFACFFLTLVIYLNLSFFYILIFGMTIILTGSKTAYLYLLMQFAFLLFLLNSNKKKNIQEKFFKYLFYIFFLIYSFLIILDLSLIYYYDNFTQIEYQPKTRYYKFYDLIVENNLWKDSTRLIMWKDIISQDINLIFGNGIYELTNYSKLKFNNFSHNSFLDIFFDFGLIGIILLFLFYLSLFDFKINQLFGKNIIAIILSFHLLIFFFFFNFTIFYLPYIWFFFPIVVFIFENNTRYLKKL